MVSTLKNLPLSASTEIYNVLRNPGPGMLQSYLNFRRLNRHSDDNDTLTFNVRTSIIPAIHHLQHMLPKESLVTVLGSELVNMHLSSLQLDPFFPSNDLRQSDIFFDSLKKKYVLVYLHI